MKTAAAIAVLLLIVASWVIALIIVDDVPPCPTEDSAGCYWDGGQNHRGWTFIVDDDGTVHQLEWLGN